MIYKELRAFSDINRDVDEIVDELGRKVERTVPDEELDSKRIISYKREGSQLKIRLEMFDTPLALKELKEGDTVILRFSSKILNISQIEKITPKGFIRVNGDLYNSDTGEMRGRSNWTRAPMLLVPTFQLYREHYELNTLKKARKILEELPRKLDFNIAKKIVDMFDDN